MTKMADNKKGVDIDHLSRLSNLSIDPEKKPLLSRQLNETIDYIKILGRLNTDKTEPAYQVTRLINVTREDKPGRGLTQKEALAGAPKTKRGYFVTKRIRWQ